MAEVRVAAAWISNPSNPLNVIVEEAIRKILKKPTGVLTKADLEKVRLLYLWHTEITGASLKEAANLKQLERLNLIRIKVTKADVA